MKRKRLLILTAALILVLGIAGGAFAAASNDSTPPGNADQWKPPVLSVNPTDEQLNKLRELRTECFNETQNIRSELQKKVFELRNLYLDNNPDQEEIASKRAEIDELRSQLQDTREEYRRQMSEIFTQEQLDQLGQMRGCGGCLGVGCGMGFGGKGGRGPGCPWRAQSQSNTQ